MGWEPNPAHTQVLVGLEEAYNKCGWKVIMMIMMYVYDDGDDDEDLIA